MGQVIKLLGEMMGEDYSSSDKLDRLTIEIKPEIKAPFVEKVQTEGHTIRWQITKWIEKYLKGGE